MAPHQHGYSIADSLVNVALSAILARARADPSSYSSVQAEETRDKDDDDDDADDVENVHWFTPIKAATLSV
jgi:hypothetical protein